MTDDDTDWTMISFEPKTKKEAGGVKASPDPLPPVAPGQCPKCRKQVGRGITMHVRKCKLTEPYWIAAKRRYK